jgi:hypothetical protein
MNPKPQRNSQKPRQMSAVLMNPEETVFVHLKWYTQGPLWHPRSIFRQFRYYGIFEVGYLDEESTVMPVMFADVDLTPSSDGRNYIGHKIQIQMCTELLADNHNMSVAYLNDCQLEDIGLFMPSKEIKTPMPLARRNMLRLPPPPDKK